VTSVEDLCSGYPKEFKNFLMYTRKLKFEEKPDYQQLISMFREAFVREGYDFDFMYDWNVKKANLKARLQENRIKNEQQINPGMLMAPNNHMNVTAGNMMNNRNAPQGMLNSHERKNGS